MRHERFKTSSSRPNGPSPRLAHQPRPRHGSLGRKFRALRLRLRLVANFRVAWAFLAAFSQLALTKKEGLLTSPELKRKRSKNGGSPTPSAAPDDGQNRQRAAGARVAWLQHGTVTLMKKSSSLSSSVVLAELQAVPQTALEMVGPVWCSSSTLRSAPAAPATGSAGQL